MCRLTTSSAARAHLQWRQRQRPVPRGEQKIGIKMNGYAKYVNNKTTPLFYFRPRGLEPGPALLSPPPTVVPCAAFKLYNGATLLLDGWSLNKRHCIQKWTPWHGNMHARCVAKFLLQSCSHVTVADQSGPLLDLLPFSNTDEILIWFSWWKLQNVSRLDFHRDLHFQWEFRFPRNSGYCVTGDFFDFLGFQLPGRSTGRRVRITFFYERSYFFKKSLNLETLLFPDWTKKGLQEYFYFFASASLHERVPDLRPKVKSIFENLNTARRPAFRSTEKW